MFRKAYEVVKSHNDTVKMIDFNMIVNFHDFLLKVIKAGYTSIASAQGMKWEDLQNCGLPPAIARTVATIFRSAQNLPANSLDNTQRESHKLRGLTFAQLLARYDINSSRDPELHKRLQPFCGDHQFIIVDDGGKVLVEDSVDRLGLLEAGFALPPFHMANGKLYQVYKLGERPDQVFEENPFYPGTPLIKGKCPKTGIDWAKVDLKTRQIAYLAVTRTNEIDVSNTTHARAALTALLENAVLTAQVATQAWINLSSLNNLPSLILSKGTTSGKPAAKQDPFGHVRT